MESRVGDNDYRMKMGFKTKRYHMIMLKKYIAREPEVDVVQAIYKDDATIAVAGVIFQDTDLELGKVADLEGYHQKEGVRSVKLDEDLSEDQRRMLKDLTERYPDVIKHRVKLTDETPIRCKPYPCRTP